LVCRSRFFTDQLVKDIFQSIKIFIIESLVHRIDNITILSIGILVSHLLPSFYVD
jgi:hypothetical protein